MMSYYMWLSGHFFRTAVHATTVANQNNIQIDLELKTTQKISINNDLV